jgi:hypothetical protein
MWLYSALLIVLLSVVCLYSRIAWRLKYPLFGNDTWGLLNISRSIQRHGFRLPKIIGNYFNDKEDWDYPPLFPYVLALMSEKTALRVNGYIPGIIDTLSSVVCGAFLAWLPTSGLIPVAGSTFVIPGMDAIESAGILYPTIGMLIVIFTPMMCIDSFQHLSARPLANLWMILALIPAYLYFLTHQWMWLALMVPPLTLIFMTHKFTLQALVFLIAGVSLYTLDPAYLLILGAGFIAALAVTGGHYSKVLRGHLSFLNFYRRMGAEKYPGKYAIDRQRLMKIIKLDATGDPWLFMLIPMIWFDGPSNFLMVIAVSMVVIYFLTSLNPLLFLGEPERYFETATFPMAVLLPFFIFRTGLWSLVLFLGLLVLSIVRIFREMRGREEQMFDKTLVIEHYVDDELLKACKFMKKHPGKRIITVSEMLQWATSYFTDKETQGCNCASQFSRYMSEFPAEPKNIKTLIEKYRVDMVLIAKASSKGFNLSFADPVFENDRYLVYDTRGFRKRRKAFL